MKKGLPFTILIVDDDEDDREIIDEAFKEIGYESEVKKFLEGQSLLKYLDKIDSSVYPSLSLIVLDNSLPGLDVEGVVSSIKEDERFKTIPVIVYSGTVSVGKKQALQKHGVDAIIEKGSTMQNVVNVVQKFKNIAESDRNRPG
jgi:CheY-like chemotaxis protein